jgi:hypothetical protein
MKNGVVQPKLRLARVCPRSSSTNYRLTPENLTFTLQPCWGEPQANLNSA